MSQSKSSSVLDFKTVVCRLVRHIDSLGTFCALIAYVNRAKIQRMSSRPAGTSGLDAYQILDFVLSPGMCEILCVLFKSEICFS